MITISEEIQLTSLIIQSYLAVSSLYFFIIAIFIHRFFTVKDKIIDVWTKYQGNHKKIKKGLLKMLSESNNEEEIRSIIDDCVIAYKLAKYKLEEITERINGNRPFIALLASMVIAALLIAYLLISWLAIGFKSNMSIFESLIYFVVTTFFAMIVHSYLLYSKISELTSDKTLVEELFNLLQQSVEEGQCVEELKDLGSI